MPNLQIKKYYQHKIQPEIRECKHCGHQNCLRVGTIFQNSKLPMLTWVRAVYLMMRGKRGISALELKRQLELGSYGTGGSPGSGFGLWLTNSDKMNLRSNRQYINTVNNYVIPSNDYVHYVVVSSGSTIYLYVNGEFISSKTTQSSFPFSYFKLGARTGAASTESVKADYDNLRLFSRQLASTEIKNIYLKIIKKLEILVLLYPFNFKRESYENIINEFIKLFIICYSSRNYKSDWILTTKESFAL